MGSKAKTGITQRIWLFLLEYGGRWSVGELAEQFATSYGYMDRAMRRMSTSGAVTKYTSSLRSNGTSFGVVPRNVMPQGLTLAAVLRATAVRSVVDPPVPSAANDGRARESA